MFLLFGAFLAGMLTVLAPCVLPLLPIIIGGSISSSDHKPNRLRPFIITVSLAISLILFTLLLKATTLLINVPPSFFTDLSGGIIVALGVFILFPKIYETLLIKLNLQARAQRLLGKSAAKKQSLLGPIVTGAALGPVFSSCSPVYAYILASILPVDFARAIAYMTSYILGLSLVLLLIGLAGQRFISKIRWASNPRGIFQRTIAVIFIIVGVLIITGNNVRIQTWVSSHTPFDLDAISAKLIPKNSQNATNSAVLNVKQPFQAPNFVGLTNWINSKPLTISQLKGKVVLVDFWTYSCINCIRSLPYLEGWYQTYQANGFVIVGVHAPEFSFEHVPSNVAAAVKKDGLTYPVALDNNFATWGAYHNQYWPADYLIDKSGKVRRIYDGEGQYTQMESAIRTLLQADGGSVTTKHFIKGSASVPFATDQTPETYLGVDRASNYSGPQPLILGQQNFTEAPQLGVSEWTLGGTWVIGDQTITAVKNSTLSIRVAARDVYMVAGASNAQKVMVDLNGKPVSTTNAAGADVTNSQVTVQMSQLYRLVHQPSFNGNMLIHLTVPAGVSLNTFTFGS